MPRADTSADDPESRSLNQPPPPRDPNIWLVAADESGTNGKEYYGYGSLWMKWQRHEFFIEEMMRIRRSHGMPDNWEIKWNKLDGIVRRRVALALVDWFFSQSWLTFHCIVVRSQDIDWNFHRNDPDLAKRKHYTLLLVQKMKQCANRHSDRPNHFKLWLDPIPSRYKKAGEAARTISSNILRSKFRDDRAIVESLEERDSRETPSIQLCDLLLGAVMHARQGQARKAEKVETALHIARHLGWPDLEADTFPEERKFNIWNFHDSRKSRAITSRHVNLKNPLPVRRGS